METEEPISGKYFVFLSSFGGMIQYEVAGSKVAESDSLENRYQRVLGGKPTRIVLPEILAKCFPNYQAFAAGDMGTEENIWINATKTADAASVVGHILVTSGDQEGWGHNAYARIVDKLRPIWIAIDEAGI